MIPAHARAERRVISQHTQTQTHGDMSTIVHIQDNCVEERSEDYLTKVAIGAAEVPVISPVYNTAFDAASFVPTKAQ